MKTYVKYYQIQSLKLHWDWKTNRELPTGNTLIRIYDSNGKVTYEDRVGNQFVEDEIIKLKEKYEI